jgi:hypothetical protein
VHSLQGISDVRIDKTAVNGVIDPLLSYRFVAIILVLLAALLLFFLTFLFQYLLYLVPGALMVALALQARGHRFDYARSYRIGLHAMTPAITYEMLSLIVPAIHVPFFFTIIMALTVYANFSAYVPTDPDTEQAEPVRADPPASPE